MRNHGIGVAALLLAGAAASVAGSTAALHLIGNTAISPGGVPMTNAGVRAALTGPGAPGGQQPTPATSTPAPSGPAHAGAPASFRASGGTVFASCSAGRVTLTSWIPGQGFQSDGYVRGPAASAWVTFTSASAELTVTATCSGGQPRFTTSADNHHGGNGGGEAGHGGGEEHGRGGSPGGGAGGNGGGGGHDG